jgi:RimJ/RimL family protein N-acetyltransferase
MLFKIPGYHVKLLQSEDAAILQALLEKCADYSLLVTGSPPGPTAATSLLADHPEGKSAKDKIVTGIFTAKQELVGVLDAIRDYPAQDDWWLGLLLLAPTYRHRGLGQRVYRSFERWAGRCGARSIYLGVIEENQGATRFWQKAGFEPVQRQPARHFGELEHVVITMVKEPPQRTQSPQSF